MRFEAPSRAPLVRTLFLAVLLISGVRSSPASAQLDESRAFFLDRGADAAGVERFGETSARGDFNGDGFDDLVVGAPRARVDGFFQAGLVEVRFGGPGGLEGAPALLLSQAQGLPGTECRNSEELDQFGNALAVGDFDGDLRDDLAVGIFGEDAVVGGVFFEGAGAVAIFWGQDDATFTPGPCLLYTEGALPGTAGDNVRFGTDLAVGDFDGNGFPDLAIGAPGAQVDVMFAGTVTVIYSQAGSPLDVSVSQLWHQDVEGVAGIADTGDLFGSSLATGDLVLGEEIACDLVIGAPGKNLDELFQGAVLTLFGCSATGLSSAGSVQYTAEDFGRIPSFGEAMGTDLAVGNFDCDSAADLAIGVPGRNGTHSDTGEVRMVYGNQMGSPRLDAFTAGDVGGDEQNTESLGRAMVAVDLGGPCTDLVVASPGRDPGFGSFNSIFSLPGARGTGLDPATAIRYQQPIESSDINLGFSLTSGRFDGDRMSVAAGAPGMDVGVFERGGRVWVLPSGRVFADGFESGDTSAWSVVVP